MSEYRLIPLTGKYSNGQAFALVDAKDFDALSKFTWWLRSDGYASRNYKIDGRSTSVLMHRFILAASAGVEVDHINANTLDNRRENLRLCTRRQNSRNRISSKTQDGFYGVHQYGKYRKWKATIRADDQRFHLGVFDTPLEAAIAYDVAARHFHKGFATLNFPNGLPEGVSIPDLQTLLSTKKTSRYQGVYWHKKQKRWCAAVTKNGKRIYLGSFGSEEEAAKATLNAKQTG